MASISNNPNGRRSIQWADPARPGTRRTLRLGKCARKTAEAVRLHVEHLLSAAAAGQSVPAETARWLAAVDDTLHARLVRAGLAAPRTPAPAVTLAAVLDAYAARRTDLKPWSLSNLTQARNALVEHFGAGRDAATINKAEARDFLRWLTGPLQGVKPEPRPRFSQATAAAHLKRARQMFADAVDRGLVPSNPFKGIKAPSQVNAARSRYVPAADVARVIAACPDGEWRLIFALARFAGLRTPTESFGLTWADVDWAVGRMLVRSSKTERHQGHESRVVPIFPELLPHLREQYESAPAGGTDRVIRDHRITNVATTAAKIIRRAGLVPWPRLFNNLRASCETDLTARFPLHVVCAWIGNSQLVAARHYLQVTDEHFRQATTAAAGVGGANSHTAPDGTGGSVRDLSGDLSELPANQVKSMPPVGAELPAEIAATLALNHKAVRNAMRRLEAAAPLMRAGDIARLTAAVRAAKGKGGGRRA
jgi:integrase